MRKSKGFTLMELMVVVFIIAILVAAAVPSYLDNLRRTRYNEGLVALQKVAQANRTFITQYPDKSLSGLISNTDTNIFTGTCKDNIDSTKTAVLVQCGYLIKDNWDSLAFNIYVCNPLSDAGGGCCAKGRYASMKYKNLAATSTATDYCGYINSNMELQEVGTPW